MSKITVNQEGICLFSDNEIVRRALLAKCVQLERLLKRPMSENERKAIQDEYERTFALTEKYGGDHHGKHKKPR